MTHHFTNKRPMPSAWSAHIHGAVRPMQRPSLWQQWREVIAQFRVRELVAGSALVMGVFAIAGMLIIALTGG